MAKKEQVLEALLRKFIQKELRRLREAEEDQNDQEDTQDQQEPEQEEQPEEPTTPEPQPEEEEGLNIDFQEGLDNFIQKLKSSTEPVENDDVVAIVTDLIDSFVSSQDGKLGILSSVKDNFLS